MNEELTEKERAEMEKAKADAEKAKADAEKAQADLLKSIEDGTFKNGFIQPVFEEPKNEIPKGDEPPQRIDYPKAPEPPTENAEPPAEVNNVEVDAEPTGQAPKKKTTAKRTAVK